MNLTVLAFSSLFLILHSGLAGLSGASLAQPANEILVSQKPKKISEDVNIKGRDPKMLEFDVILTSGVAPNTKILYDRAVEGDMCFISCNFYNGVTSKWGDYFLYLQPFENFCLTLAGCSGQYPSPSNEIAILVDGNRHVLRMTKPDENGYYMPLSLRKEIALSTSQLIVEIAGVKMPIYKIGESNSKQIKKLVNTTDELDVANGDALSKEARLKELQVLYEKGLITDKELEAARLKVLLE